MDFSFLKKNFSSLFTSVTASSSLILISRFIFTAPILSSQESKVEFNKPQIQESDIDPDKSAPSLPPAPTSTPSSNPGQTGNSEEKVSSKPSSVKPEGEGSGNPTSGGEKKSNDVSTGIDTTKQEPSSPATTDTEGNQSEQDTPSPQAGTEGEDEDNGSSQDSASTSQFETLSTRTSYDGITSLVYWLGKITGLKQN